MRKFGSQQGLQRAQEFLDRFARAAWEPFHKNENGYGIDTPASDYKRQDGEQVTKLWEELSDSAGLFRAGLQRYQGKMPRSEPLGNPPAGGVDIAAWNSNWTYYEFDQLIDIVASDAVRSVADAVVKATAYLGLVSGSLAHGKKRYLFRGQTNIEYSLVPSLGRGHLNGLNGQFGVEEFRRYEAVALKEFQSNWPVATADEFDRMVADKLQDDDATWWFLMQHFADGGGSGTRLLDVTSSLLMGLLFACVSWQTGTVDNKKDGIVYLFLEGENSVVNDFDEEKLPAANDFFEEKHEVRHMILDPPHNERSKAQSGGYIWWRDPWKPQNQNLPFLRVPGEYKLAVAAELLAFGVGPKAAVRGERGANNEKALRQQIASSQ